MIAADTGTASAADSVFSYKTRNTGSQNPVFHSKTERKHPEHFI